VVTLRYLLDTNVLSEPLRPRPNERVMERLREAENAVATAALVWHELRFGAARLEQSKRRTTIAAYLDDVVGPTIPVLPYDQNVADWHATERARLVAAGQTPPFVDGQIAAIAAVNGLIVVTATVADYELFSGLTIENWHE
jgi:tRNA(fMet)-specific endonuclease VapC